MLPDLHIGFSRGRSGGLVFPSLDYYLHIKKIEIMPFAATWMDLDSVKLSEVKSDREGEISYDIPYMWNLKRNDTNELTYKT